MQQKLEDKHVHKGLRKQMVDLLREKGITDETVLTAINAVPRHYFLDSAFVTHAYEDRAFPIGEGQTISHPHTVAYQTQLLQINKSDKVLEIGTGSVYQATILAEMGARVYTIERQKKLYDLLPTYAPFDKIIITAAAPFIPPKLVEQLKPGGIMVLPVNEGEGDQQRMIRITKDANGAITETSFDIFSFVPMLTGKNR
jgi:protein-L-isoaspartate(D-aspartate) O-methyltransferase